VLSISLGGPVPAAPAPDIPAAMIMPDHDQVIARMPGPEAQIAPVMLAKLTIALHEAKKQAADALCQGHWLPDGERLMQFGPAPATLGDGSRVWAYQDARRALPLACDQVSRAQFFLEMSRHLPAWVTVRPAGQLTGYRQGTALFVAPSHLATR
jgi:hypothetical protein